MPNPLLHRLGAIGFGIALFCPPAASAQMAMPMSHGAGAGACHDPVLACASTVTPVFAPDGTLFLAFDVNDRVFVSRSADRGRSFAAPVAITPDKVNLDNGPDARAAIAVDRGARVFVAYAIFKDAKYNGEVFFSRSLDGGKTFAPPRPLVDNTASQRFATLTVDPGGGLFAAWLDKRGVVAAAKAGRHYPGAALAFSWSEDGGASFSPSRIAHDNSCECCRLGVAFAAPQRPAVLFRNVFGGTVRDHAIITFAAATDPGPLARVSVDDWKLDGCPHQGPSLAVSPGGTYHAVWSTQGDVRKGLFYARSSDGGMSFSPPMALGNADHDLSRPYVAALPGAVWIAWKDFDGDEAAVQVILSRDDGLTWSAPRVVTKTADASDHPMLVSDGQRAYLSWMTKIEGYRFVALEEAP